MKVEYVVGEAKSALDDGKCVVIGLQNTGEVIILQAVSLHKNLHLCVVIVRMNSCIKG
mgnify:CR=1 FL=1